MQNTSNIAIIQARVDSTRLHNKIFLKIGKYKLIDWVILRLKKSKKINKIILSIPISKKNDPLKSLGIKHELEVVRGDEQNVFKRFLKSIKKINNSNIIRVCADNPLVDSNHVDLLIEFFDSNNFDFAYNHRPLGKCKYPDGFGAEIFKSETFKKISSENLEKSQKEHVTKYFFDNKDHYKISFLQANKNLCYPKMKFDIDTKDDLNYMNNLINEKKINLYDSAEDIIKKIIKK